MGFALVLPSNSKTQLERVTKGKPSSLLGLVNSDKGKKFYNIDIRTKSPALPSEVASNQNFGGMPINPNS